MWWCCCLLAVVAVALGQSCDAPAPDLPNLSCISGVWTCSKDVTLNYDLDLATAQVNFEGSFTQSTLSKISVTVTNANMATAFLRVNGNASLSGTLNVKLSATDVVNGSVITVISSQQLEGSFSLVTVVDDTDNNCQYDALQQTQGAQVLQVKLIQSSCDKSDSKKKGALGIIIVVVILLVLLGSCITVCVLYKKGKIKRCCKEGV